MRLSKLCGINVQIIYSDPCLRPTAQLPKVSPFNRGVHTETTHYNPWLKAEKEKQLAQTNWMRLLPNPVYVVDEISHATELNMYHVLKRVLRKLVCVGQDKQLPRVVKQINVRGILDRSLVERVRGEFHVKQNDIKNIVGPIIKYGIWCKAHKEFKH